MNNLSDAVERLTRGMEALERRVSALEISRLPAPALAPQPAPAAPASNATEKLSPAGNSALFAVLGKAMLGIAGAYLLRAAVQSGALPRWPVIAVSIAYALVWLIPATRVPEKAWLASAAWAGTSALILMPSAVARATKSRNTTAWVIGRGMDCSKLRPALGQPSSPTTMVLPGESGLQLVVNLQRPINSGLLWHALPIRDDVSKDLVYSVAEFRMFDENSPVFRRPYRTGLSRFTR